MDKTELAEKLYLAHKRGWARHKKHVVKPKPWDRLDDSDQAAWLSVAAAACHPDTCEHLATNATAWQGKIEKIEERHAGNIAALEAQIEAMKETAEEKHEAKGDALARVIEDVDNAIAASMEAKDFEHTTKLIGYKAGLLGLA